MQGTRKLMAIFAHPDDETLGLGPVVARYAAEGIEVSLITATRGERGWFGVPAVHPGEEALGRLREAELHAAASVLGISRVDFLGALDGELASAEPAPLIARIVKILREVRPQVVVSFGPEGDYGHPDHIAISQLAAAAMVCAADSRYQPDEGEPHRVLKYYYMITGEKTSLVFRDLDIRLEMEVDGETRSLTPWPEWAITTRINAFSTLPTVQRAIRCHTTQLPSLPGIDTMPLEDLARLVGESSFYRAFSLVNNNHGREDDLFAGIDEPAG